MTEGTLVRYAARTPWRAYLELTKPRVVALMVFTVAVGMLLARPDLPPWSVMLGGTLGIALVAGAAAAINHLIDRRIDALMARTRARPLPSGTVGAAQAFAFAVTLGGAGVALLIATTNPLCALLSVAALLGYAVVYSAYLKRATPQNIVIGGAAGAAPPLLGWVAVTGAVEPGALLLFTIILLWTPPHFWALAIHRRDDYARAEVPMLPVTHGIAFTSERIVHYSIATALIALAPVAIGMSGWLYGLGAAAFGVRFVDMALRLRREPRWAMPAFRYSIVYLFALFALLLGDHFLRG
ncbi:MAG: protoheme IX farnesyltransferase [Burkholderiales bacterium]|nr:protoheme IX farnesyltransferase [Burkholderiales bacterium]